MKKTTARKKTTASADEKVKVVKLINAMVAACSPLPDMTNLFSTIRELERSSIDYTSLLCKIFSTSSITTQGVMINHIFPHLKRMSLNENLKTMVQRETLAPRIIIDILHYLIRSDTIIDHTQLESANNGEEIVNQLLPLLESKDTLESQEATTLVNRLCETSPALGLGIIMELVHLQKEKILPLLKKIFSTNNSIAHKVVDLLGSFADHNAVHMLNQLLPATQNKELAKNIKKTLYRLKNKGIELAQPEPVAVIGTDNYKEPVASPTAYCTTIDPLGERLILAAEPKSNQELTIVQFLVSDQKGISDLIVSTTTTKDLTTYITKMRDEKDITMVEIDISYCHLLIRESSQKNHISGTPIPANYFLWKKLFGKYDANLNQAMIYTLLNAEKITSQEFLLRRSAELIGHHKCMFWLLEWKFLIERYKEIYEIDKTMLVLTEYQKESRISDLVKKTASTFFDDTNRHLFQRRLEDTAYILWKTGKQEDAKSAFAAALSFAPGGVPSEHNLFALKTVEENFKFLKEQSQKEKRSESGNIILP